MTGWVVYDAEQYRINTWFADELLRYCRAFCDARLIISDRLSFGVGDDGWRMSYDGEVIEKPDLAITRTIFPLLSFFLEESGVRVFNDHRTSKICNDKRLTYMSVRGAAPVMDTVFCDRGFFDIAQAEGIGYPAVLKSASGHGGKEVFLINSAEELSEKIGSLRSSGFLLQKLCYPYGQDLRVYVLGGRVVGSVMRSSDGFRSNYSLGGRAESYDLSREESALVDGILRAVPFSPDFVGIDFLYSGGRLIFNEMEDVVGTRMLYDAADIDAAAMYTEYIRGVMTDGRRKG